MQETLTIKNTKQNYYLTQLQFIKFIAFIFVFALHTTDFTKFYYGYDFGALAVAFYFVCTGFTSGYTCALHENNDISFKKTISRVFNKIKRVYPLHFVTTIAFLVLTPLPRYISDYYFEGVIPEIKQLLSHLLLIQCWFSDGRYYNLNGVSWFLSTVFFLYFFTDLFTSFVRRIKSKKTILVCIAISIVLFALYNIIISKISDNLYWRYNFPPSRIFEYFISILTGNLIFRTTTEINDMQKLSSVKWTMIEILALLIWFLCPLIPYAEWMTPCFRWLIPNLIVLSVFSFGRGMLSELFRKPLFVRLGQAQFECYIIHFLIITTNAYLIGFSDMTKLGVLFMVMLDFVITLIFGLMLSRSTK